MEITEPHTLGQGGAIRRLDEYVDQLAASSFPGVTITDLDKQWNEGVLSLSFRAKKGFFSKKITGAATVTEASVELRLDLPGIVYSFVSKEEVETAVRAKLRERLTGPAGPSIT